MSERILADSRADIEDTGGVGGTLAGNALSAAEQSAAAVFAAAADELIG